MLVTRESAVPTDLDVIGRRYEVDAVYVDPSQARAYAEVAGDDPERYDPFATHPCFVINPAMHALERLLSDPVLAVSRASMLHGQSDMKFLQPLVPGDKVNLEARILDAGAYGWRHAYVVETTASDAAGQPLVRIETTLAFDHPVPGSVGRPPLSSPPALRTRKPPVAVAERWIGPDLPARYAAASGDDNPIHLDDEAARAAGLPGVIVHGMATMAIGCTEAVAGPCGGDPSRLRRMRVRFSKPTAPGCNVAYAFHATDLPGVLAVTAHADGRPIWKQSIVEVSQGASR